MNKRKHIPESSEEDDDEEEEEGEGEGEESATDAYFVEVITKAKVMPKGKFQYFVKWANYSSDDDSWEPHENVKDCIRLLKSFWKEIGTDKRKNPGPLDTVYKASTAWIAKEKAIFQEDAKVEAERKERAKKEKKEKKRSNLKEPKRKKMLGSTSSNRPSKEPLPQVQSASKFSKSVASLADPESDSDSDKPLSKPITRHSTGKVNAPTKVASKAPAKASTSKVKGSEDRSTSSPAPVVKNKYAGMKIAKKTSTVPGSDVDTSNLASTSTSSLFAPPPPRLSASEINVHASRARPIPQQRQSDLNLNDDSIYRSLFPNAEEPEKQPEIAVDDQVENLLETIASRSAAAALKPSELAKQRAIEAISEQVSSVSLTQKTTWKWEGELFVTSPSGLADHFCDISFNDIEEVNSAGFKFKILFDSKDSIRLDRLYSLFEMRSILRALRRVDQFATMSARTPTDVGPLSFLRRYMLKRGLGACTSIITDFGHVGELIIFPNMSDLCRPLQVPDKLMKTQGMIVAIMPWSVPPSVYTPLHSIPPVPFDNTTLDEEAKQWSNCLPDKRLTPKLIAALNLLHVPEGLLKKLPKQNYCLWSKGVDPPPENKGRAFAEDLRPETAALLAILNTVQAENVGYKKDVNYVFVHIGAMKTLHKLEALVERRCRRPEIQFFTYGRHENVKPTFWGIHEIYPLGGIVTFTPSALLEDPMGIASLILKLHKHPLWECYLLPSVLAVYVKRASLPDNPKEVFVNEPLRFGRILQLINEGKIALMNSPSLAEQPTREKDPSPSDEWITTQLRFLVKTPADLVDESWRMYIAKFSSKSDHAIQSSIESEIALDLLRLHVSPAMRNHYRRFVVIKGTAEKGIEWDRSGFEWHPLADFRFKDDLYPTTNTPAVPKTS